MMTFLSKIMTRENLDAIRLEYSGVMNQEEILSIRHGVKNEPEKQVRTSGRPGGKTTWYTKKSKI